MFLWVYTTDWLTWVHQIVYWQVLDYYWLLDFVRNFSIINCSAWFTDCRLRVCSAFHNNQQVAQIERLPVYIKYCVIMYACGTEGSSWKKKGWTKPAKYKSTHIFGASLSSWGGGASAGDASVGGASADGSMLLPVDASPSGVSFLPFPLYVQALASFRHRGVTYRNVCGRRTVVVFLRTS